MAQSDVTPAIAVTRTSETNVAPDLLERPVRVASSSSTPTLPLEPAKPDPAAVSFALERERVLRRCEHTASVQRLRQAITIGIPFWLGALGLDLWALSWRKKQASGEMYVVRYADDFVMGFQKRAGRKGDAPSFGSTARRLRPAADGSGKSATPRSGKSATSPKGERT